MSGGEALGEETLAWGRKALGVTVNEAYGQTEANLLVGNSNARFGLRAGSMGRPYPGHRIDLHGLDGAPVPVGTVGEIVLETPDPAAFLGYWRNPAATAAKFDGPWLRTGDLARQDEDGYMWFQARDADMIKSAGYRIGPVEVEEALLRHPAVLTSAVIGVPDKIRGESVKAFVVLHEGWAPTSKLEDEIRDHVRTRLSSYQYPRYIEFIDELPLTATGKIRRSELRKRDKEGRAGI
jgi:acetyl-CoA synthetase